MMKEKFDEEIELDREKIKEMVTKVSQVAKSVWES